MNGKTLFILEREFVWDIFPELLTSESVTGGNGVQRNICEKKLLLNQMLYPPKLYIGTTLQF